MIWRQRHFNDNDVFVANSYVFSDANAPSRSTRIAPATRLSATLRARNSIAARLLAPARDIASYRSITRAPTRARRHRRVAHNARVSKTIMSALSRRNSVATSRHNNNGSKFDDDRHMTHNVMNIAYNVARLTIVATSRISRSRRQQ